MKYHIVSDQETLQKIAFLYDLTEEEIKKENKHIRLWNRLVPGTKLKIPVISEAMNQDLNDIEPFIEDYYPKLKIDFEDTIIKDQEEIPIEDIKITEIKEEKEEVSKKEEEPLKNEEIPELVKMKEYEEKYNKVKQNLRPIYYSRQVMPYPYNYRPIIYVYPNMFR